MVAIWEDLADPWSKFKWTSGRQMGNISNCSWIRNMHSDALDSSALEHAPWARAKTYLLKFKGLIGVVKLSSAGDRQIPKCSDPFLPGQSQDYTQKIILIFFILTTYQIWDQIWKRLAVVISPGWPVLKIPNIRWDIQLYSGMFSPA